MCFGGGSFADTYALSLNLDMAGASGSLGQHGRFTAILEDQVGAVLAAHEQNSFPRSRGR
jgi:hypothetical protein